MERGWRPNLLRAKCPCQEHIYTKSVIKDIFIISNINSSISFPNLLFFRASNFTTCHMHRCNCGSCFWCCINIFHSVLSVFKFPKIIVIFQSVDDLLPNIRSLRQRSFPLQLVLYPNARRWFLILLQYRLWMTSDHHHLYCLQC